MEYLLLLAGIVGVGIWATGNLAPVIWQDWENWVFDRAVQGQSASVGEYLAARTDQIARGIKERLAARATPESSNSRSAPAAASAPPAPTPPPPQPTLQTDSLIGRLTIPRLHLRAIVREGAGAGTLSLAVGHIPGTALPWQKGNFGVAGHRDTLFRGMGAMRKNDLIRFDTFDTSYVYQVASTQIVAPKDVGVLKSGPDSELTLVTCYPFNYLGSAPERYIVKAREVSQAALRQSDIQKASAPETAPAVAAVASLSSPRRVSFSVPMNHSRQLAPGISLGVTATDTSRQRMDGWMWLMPDRRTVWLRDQGIKGPCVFYGYADGKRRELVITRVTSDSVMGYLML
jgi:sortase A